MWTLGATITSPSTLTLRAHPHVLTGSLVPLSAIVSCGHADTLCGDGYPPGPLEG
jgi:hypothetical protein